MACWRTAWLAAIERRASFMLQVAMMILNDTVWVVFWLLVFSHRRSIRGWDVHEVLVLMAVMVGAFGLGLGACHGTRRLGREIRSGGVDSLLAQPQPVLLRIMSARIHPPFLGDALFAPVLFILSGLASLQTWGWFLLAVLCGAAMLVGYVVLLESLSFWTRAGDEISTAGFGAMTVLGMYPADVYAPGVKILAFTLLPAAFVSTVPSHMILEGSWTLLGVLALAAVIVWVLAVTAFNAGLRRHMHA